MSLLCGVWISLFIVVIDATFTQEPATSSAACIGSTYNFPWIYSVTPNDAFSVVWRKDGLTILTWMKGGNTYSYGAGYSAAKVTHNNNNGDISIQSLNSGDAGTYICRVTYTTGVLVISSDAVLRTSSCNALCEGIQFVILVLIVISVCPQAVQGIIVIIIIIYEIQKVTITARVDKEKTLTKAEQTINSGDNQQIPIINHSECAIVVQGEDLHQCKFITNAGALNMEFKIKDDLLNVKHGKAITLPTMLSVDKDYSTIHWTHDGKALVNGSLFFETKVNQATYGVYDIKMTFQNLGLTILIEKMRVQAVRVRIVIIICVSFNLAVGVIGGVILVLYRTTDGFCSNVYVIIIIVLACVFVFNLLHVTLVYFLMTNFTGKGKNSGFCDNVLCYADVSPCQEQANDVTTTSQTGAVSPAVVPTASTTGVVSSSDVAASTTDDQDRRNWRPLPLPENYTVKIMPLTINEGNNRNLKENAEHINLLDKRL